MKNYETVASSNNRRQLTLDENKYCLASEAL